jgi:hypothetical protein
MDIITINYQSISEIYQRNISKLEERDFVYYCKSAYLISEFIDNLEEV